MLVKNMKNIKSLKKKQGNQRKRFAEKKSGNKFIKIKKLFKMRETKKRCLLKGKWQQKPFKNQVLDTLR